MNEKDIKEYNHSHRFINLHGIKNIRDLGGYKSKNIKTTLFNKIIRSAGLHRMTEPDKKELIKLNVKTVIDLRSAYEIEINPDPLIGNDIKYYNIPIGNVDISVCGKYGLDVNHISSFYILMLIQSQDLIKKVFDAILENKERGATIIHCTAGKDRTGIISAMLLMLCEIEEYYVLEDYSLSNEYLNPIMDKVKAESYPGLDDEFFKSDREYIKKFIDYINKNYKGIYEYFKILGYTENDIKKLSNILY